jgi:hypothetical protein
LRADVADCDDLILCIPRSLHELLWCDRPLFAYADDIPKLERAAKLIRYTGRVVEER